MPAAITVKVRATEIDSVKSFLAAAIPALRAHRRGCRPKFDFGPGWKSESFHAPCALCDALAVAESSGLIPGAGA